MTANLDDGGQFGGQVNDGQVDGGQVDVGQAGGQVEGGQVDVTQIGFGQVGGGQVDAGEVDVSQLGFGQLGNAQVDGGQLGGTQVNGGQVFGQVQAAGRTALEVVLDPNGREDVHEFRPGEMVAGTVRVTLEEPSELRGIEVQLQGVGTIQWNERVPGAQGEANMPVVGQEQYLSETQNILGTYPGILYILHEFLWHTSTHHCLNYLLRKRATTVQSSHIVCSCTVSYRRDPDAFARKAQLPVPLPASARSAFQFLRCGNDR